MSARHGRIVQLRQLWNVTLCSLVSYTIVDSISTGVDAFAGAAEGSPPGLVDDEAAAAAIICALAAFALASCNACVSMALIC